MAKSVFVQLTIAGDDTGPTYNVFAINGVGVYTTLASQVLRENLLAGVTYTNVPDDAVIIKVCSHDNEVCTNCVEIPIVGITTSTTSTSFTTSTTTTEAPVEETIQFVLINVFEQGVIGINPSSSRAFLLSFAYEITATADNYLDSGSARSNTVTVESSTDWGASWNLEDQVTATTDIGYLNQDNKTKSGLFSLSSMVIANGKILVKITGSCGTNSIGTVNSEGWVQIVNALPDTGNIPVIGANDRYNAACDGGGLVATLS